MRKLTLLSVACFSVVVISCNHASSDDATKKTGTDSVAKTDSDKHDKLVRALVTDTNQHNFTDAQGKKQGHWIITNATMHLKDYDSTAKVEEGSYQDNMKEGEWMEYNADGSVKSKTIFKDDKQVQ
jgi:antitoxin component YwqK of YwqJK toxin-antitoxin module